MSEEELSKAAEWAQWVANQNMAPDLRVVAERYPAYRCYLSTDSLDYHYKIVSYGRSAAGKPTVQLVHGADDPMAGIATFGQDPAQLMPCDCGKWQSPTAEQRAEIGKTRGDIEAMRALFAHRRKRLFDPLTGRS